MILSEGKKERILLASDNRFEGLIGDKRMLGERPLLGDVVHIFVSDRGVLDRTEAVGEITPPEVTARGRDPFGVYWNGMFETTPLDQTMVSRLPFLAPPMD